MNQPVYIWCNATGFQQGQGFGCHCSIGTDLKAKSHRLRRFSSTHGSALREDGSSGVG